MAALVPAVPADRLAEFRETTREYFQKFIDRMRTELGDLRHLPNVPIQPGDDAVTRMNKGNVALIHLLIHYPNPEPDASNFVRNIEDANFTPAAFTMMDTIMTAVNTDPLLLNHVLVAKILLTADIQLLYNLPPRPPEVNARVYLTPIWGEYDEAIVLINDAERDGVIAILHEIIANPTVPPPAKKKGGRKSKKNKKRKRRSRRN